LDATLGIAVGRFAVAVGCRSPGNPTLGIAIRGLAVPVGGGRTLLATKRITIRNLVCRIRICSQYSKKRNSYNLYKYFVSYPIKN
jgi:hypothetical protein